MEYATFMWVKARFDAAEKRVEALDGRVHELATAVLALVATLQTQGASEMDAQARLEAALADLKLREDALLARDAASAAAAAQTTSDLAVAQAKVQAISEQLSSVSADRDTIKGQLDDLNKHLADMATAAETARDELPPVPVAVDPNAGGTSSTDPNAGSAPAASGDSTGSASSAPSDSGAATPSASDSTTPASSASPADGSGAAPGASPAPAASDAGTASAPAATATPADPAQVGTADPVVENVSDGAAASNTPAA